MDTTVLAWLGIAFCISQSAIFSGLNLAFFSVNRLQLEVEAERGNQDAEKILRMRKDSNFLLATILWGNVSINVLLTLLSDSVLAGVYGFLFSTIAITFLGEIFPQAYFSRNALRIASMLSPVIRFYQILLFPVAKFTALLLDGWLGREGITYYMDKELRAIIGAHVKSEDAEAAHVEGIGAMNFLTIDDVLVSDEGELIDPKSVIVCACKLDLPLLPKQDDDGFESFVKQVHSSGHKWVVLTNKSNEALLTLDADGFLRAAWLDEAVTDPYAFAHRPLVIQNQGVSLGQAIQKLKTHQHKHAMSDETLDRDLILVWGKQPRIITGADILGRLLRGISEDELFDAALEEDALDADADSGKDNPDQEPNSADTKA